MTHTCRYSQTLWAMAAILVTALLFATPSYAQTVDLKIMVSGPWAYVNDPSDKTRIYLVAPPSDHHKAFIFPGTKADNFWSQGAYMVGNGKYQLDFDQKLRAAYTPTPQEATVVSYATVKDRNKVKAILSDKNNYVISLPMPDDYSTYVDQGGDVDGYSEMKVSPNPVKSSTAPQLFTTLMVLHYSVKSIPASVEQTGTAMKSISTAGSNGGAAEGISIVSGDPFINNADLECDSISLESFNAQNKLWGLKGYARFPKQSIQNNQARQIHYVYVDRCNNSVPNPQAMKQQEITEKNNLSGGGADCHAYQISINKAGPPPS